jgi:hypothetical protein
LECLLVTISRKVAGSIPDDVTGIFHGHNPSGRTMALGLSASKRNEYQGYFWRQRRPVCRAAKPYHIHVSIVLKCLSLNLLEPSWPVKVCNLIAYLTIIAITFGNFSSPK